MLNGFSVVLSFASLFKFTTVGMSSIMNTKNRKARTTICKILAFLDLRQKQKQSSSPLSSKVMMES